MVIPLSEFLIEFVKVILGSAIVLGIIFGGMLLGVILSQINRYVSGLLGVIWFIGCLYLATNIILGDYSFNNIWTISLFLGCVCGSFSAITFFKGFEKEEGEEHNETATK